MTPKCKNCSYYYREDYELITSCHYDEDASEPAPCEYYDDSYELQHDK